MTSVPNQDAAQAPKRRWPWWQLALAAVAAILLLSVFGRSPSLKVTLSRNGEIQIQNTGQKAIEVRGVRVNDEASCKVATMLNLGNPDAHPWPINLDVGSGVGLIPFCRAVRIAIDTNAGSATYEFE